ncbi:ATP-binding cassette domain-containing protein [Amycolatopsis sp. NPDC004747]
MIHASGLARTFTSRAGSVDAVRGVDIDVGAGELVGFLGPNGAGKSTTLRMLTTLLRPTRGTAAVAGLDLLADPAGVRRRIGYVAQGGATASNVPIGDELVTHGRFYRMPKADAVARAQALYRQLDLAGLDRRPARTLSGGQRRRVDIAMALIHRPRLIFLDEPTAGLDPQSRSNLWEHIRGLRAEHGVTVFLTTHYLEEADQLCDRVLVIDAGAIVAEGTPAELKRKVSGDAVTLTIADPARIGAATGVVARTPGAQEVVTDGPTVRFRVPEGDAALPGLLHHLAAESVSLASIGVQRPTLDDVFFALTGRALREPESAGAAVPAGGA